MKMNKARELRSAIVIASASLDDTVAIGVPELFPVWVPGVEYSVDDRVRYKDILYRVLISHTSQAAWKPDESPSLFARVLIPDPEVIPDWVQPDSTNPYMKGDKVRYDGKIWESAIDNNVWVPGTAGLWIEVEF